MIERILLLLWVAEGFTVQNDYPSSQRRQEGGINRRSSSFTVDSPSSVMLPDGNDQPLLANVLTENSPLNATSRIKAVPGKALSFDTPIHNFESMWACIDFTVSFATDMKNGASEQPMTEREEENWYVVMYHAAWCKVCQRASITYKKIATEYDNLESGDTVHFLRAPAGEWAANKNEDDALIRSSPTPMGTLQDIKEIGITKFPFVQVFRGSDGACVASFATGASHLFARRVRETLKQILDRTPSEWRDFESNFDYDIWKNQKARSHVRQRLKHQLRSRVSEPHP